MTASFSPRVGAIVSDAGVTFRVWAPAVGNVSLVLEDRDDVAMTAEPHGYFATTVRNAAAGERYWFRVKGALRPDPASRFQPEGPLGPSQIVDPHRFKWSDDDWPGAGAAHRHVIYEMHLGTFTEEGTWRGAERYLANLADLGITTLEVMPIAEFAGRFGWGYDGVDLFAPSHLYGTPDDARHFVDAAHRAGLAVILDVVYNHLGPVGNFLAQYSATYFGKPGEWGDEINFDGAGAHGVRALVIENAAHWIAEYHFDGLRLDATQGIHDSSPDHIISELARAARLAAGRREIFIVAESEPQDVTILRHGGKYSDGVDAVWNEDWHHAAFVALTHQRSAYFTDYEGTASEFAAMARHGFLYQGQWYSWQSNTRGGYSFGLPPQSFVAFLENHDQVANTGSGQRLHRRVAPGKWRALTALLLAGPQLPLLFQGQEFASPRPFTYFADHDGELGDAVRKGRLEFLAQFPALATEEMQQSIVDPRDEQAFRTCRLRDEDRAMNHEMFALHRDLLHLRREDAVLSRIGTVDVSIESAAVTPDLLLLRYMSPYGDRLLVVNLGVDLLSSMNNPLFAAPPWQKWTCTWSSEERRYGGEGAVPFSESGRWLIPGATATLLYAQQHTRR